MRSTPDTQVLHLKDLIQTLVSQFEKENISPEKTRLLFLNKLIDFFQDKLGKTYIDEEGQNMVLTWTVVRHYLIQHNHFKKEYLAPQFLLATEIHNDSKRRVNYGLEVKHGTTEATYFFENEVDAKRQLVMVQFLISDCCPDFESKKEAQIINSNLDPNKPFSFKLDRNEETALQDICFPDRLIKSVRFDERCFLDAFITSITHTAGKNIAPRGELRKEVPRKQFTVFGDGPIERSKKPAHYPYQNQKEKLHLFPLLSRHQSTSLITQEAQTPVFGMDRETSAVGVILDPEDALFNRMMTYDGGTIARPYDHDTLQEAEEFFNEKK